MKILVIAKRFVRNFTKSLNEYQSGIRISEELKRQGHEVVVFFYDSNIEEIEKCYLEFQPHFVFQTGGVNRSFETLKCLKSLDAKIVIWHPDAYWLLQEDSKKLFLEAFEIVDLFITTMKGHVEISLPYTDKVVWCPQFFDYTYYKSDKKLSKDFDVIFIGNKHPISPQREEYLESIFKSGYSLNVIGWGWNKFKGAPKYSGLFVADHYRCSKIGLNIISGGKYNYKLQFSVRVYQIMGSGCFLLTEYIPGIEELFVPGKHLDVFHTKEEMIEKIDYYLKHEEERERIALEGQKEVFDKYTIDKSVKRYLSVIQERFNL